jgi:hypothetical protein
VARSILERIQDLERQKQALLSDAKKEALAKVEAAVAELNALGFNYVLSEAPGTSSSGNRVGTRGRTNRPCPICKFKTAPPHDGRRHRSQGGNKKPFTVGELQKLGYEKA